MVKVAVPVFEGRLSPVFDTCMRLAYFEVEGGRVTEAGEEDVSSVPAVLRPRLLAERSVSVLLCGGISGMLHRALTAAGITVYPWLAGGARQVVEAFAAEGAPDVSFAAPGCRGPGRGRRRGGGRCRRMGGRGRGRIR